jgi:hypothetical protein
VKKPAPNPHCKRCGRWKSRGRGRRFCQRCHDDYQATLAAKRCCRVCGGPRPPRKQMCEECSRNADWRRSKRDVIKRRQPCEGCGGPKGPGARRRYCDRCRAERERSGARMCERCQIRPPRYARAKLCLRCHALAQKRRLSYRNRWNRRVRANGRTYPSDATRAKATETWRLYDRMRRDREGRPRKPIDPEVYAERYGRGYGRIELVPAAPLTPLVRRALTRESEIELAGRAGISDKRIREIVGGQGNIALVTADKLCVALGYTLSLVYPEAA